MVSQTSNPLGANRSYDPSDAIRRSNGNNNHSVNNNYNMRNRSNGEQNGNHVSTSKDDKFEVPLPFGYHMDLDFLRFCSEQANSGETLERLKELRRMRRRERKTLESLVGSRQNRERSISLEPRNVTIHQRPTTPDFLNASEFARDALEDAVYDFEQCFQGTSRSNESAYNSFDLGNIHSSTPVGRSNTFPRSYFSNDSRLYRPPSNSSISSISTSSSAKPLSSEALLAQLPSSVPPKSRDPNTIETESIVSINSDMSTATLKNIREQIARSLIKLKEYEKQVESIPVLQVKLSVLKEEKRLLILQLKQRELQLRRQADQSYIPDDHEDYGLDSEDEELEDQRNEVCYMTEDDIKQHYDSLRRARSESPYNGRLLTVNPDDFISVRKMRSTSCGYNSEDSDFLPYQDKRRHFHQKKESDQIKRVRGIQHALNNKEIQGNLRTEPPPPPPPVMKVPTHEVGCNTDPGPSRQESPPKIVVSRKRERGTNTDPPPKQPSPPRKTSVSTNTNPARGITKATATSETMGELFSKAQLEAKIQEAVFKTEEDIMACPLLQKAMARVEAEAVNGGPLEEPRVQVDTDEFGCQVGDEHLRPFVISVGLQCKLDGDLPVCIDCQNKFNPDTSGSTSERLLNAIGLPLHVITRSIGVGDCKVIEDPKGPIQVRDVGICTEKWVEVIKASKQTDTEDFAFKDTESPRVADLVFEPSPERVVLQRKSSLRRASTTSSPSPSRKSSASNKTFGTQTASLGPTRAQGTMTDDEKKVSKKDAKVGGAVVQTKSVGVSVDQPRPLTLDLSPRVTVCDKCSLSIVPSSRNSSVSPAPKIHAPPSPDFPWLSKIPRPIPENPDIQRLKSATSTGNIYLESNSPSRSPAMMQRSKSTLSSTGTGKGGISPKVSSPMSPTMGRKDFGTPPPHPSIGRRVSSPLTRSYSPYSPSPGEKRSLIPKLSLGNISAGKSSQTSSGPVSPASAETRSLIPRVETPPALRKLYPKPSDGGEDKLALKDRNVVRKTTYTKAIAGVANPALEDNPKEPKPAPVEGQKQERKKSEGGNMTDDDDHSKKSNQEERTRRLSSSGFPLPGAALFTPIDINRSKAEPSREMRAALKVLNDSMLKGSRSNNQITNAVNIVQQEWFKSSSTKQSNPLDVEDYLDAIEDISKELLDRVVNLTDVNGNTALHYSVSHGNFDVVSVLLDSKVANPNILNKAGYTCIMLISLAQIQNETHRSVVRRLFGLGDVNIRATQHGQTALMLAVSHGRLDMVQLLVEAGADVNIRDEDGSTALMCAAEHGQMEIVKYLIQNQETDILAKDNDGLTALAVAMEAGHRDVGVILYANTSLSRGSSPYSSMRVRRPPSTSRGSTPMSERTPPPQVASKSPAVPTPPLRTRRRSIDN